MVNTRELKGRINAALGNRGKLLSLAREDKCDLEIKWEEDGHVRSAYFLWGLSSDTTTTAAFEAWQQRAGSDRIKEDRLVELDRAWNESDLMDDEEYRDWYEGLTSEEQALIDAWDKKYAQGVGNICEDILEHERRGSSTKAKLEDLVASLPKDQIPVKEAPPLDLGLEH